MGGRSVLIRTSLSSTTVYHMSMFLLPKTTIHMMEKNKEEIFLAGWAIKKEISPGKVGHCL
jgi:hypothetical protein